MRFYRSVKEETWRKTFNNIVTDLINAFARQQLYKHGPTRNNT
jgi:hypothetical protein